MKGTRRTYSCTCTHTRTQTHSQTNTCAHTKHTHTNIFLHAVNECGHRRYPGLLDNMCMDARTHARRHAHTHTHAHTDLIGEIGPLVGLQHSFANTHSHYTPLCYPWAAAWGFSKDTRCEVDCDPHTHTHTHPHTPEHALELHVFKGSDNSTIDKNQQLSHNESGNNQPTNQRMLFLGWFFSRKEKATVRSQDKTLFLVLLPGVI